MTEEQATRVTSSPVVFICGPTGSGKTAVSLELAQKLGGEVVNSDVYQMYKGLSIATAKITQDEMQNVPHHLLSVYDPKEQINVTHFVSSAKTAIDKIQGEGKVPIVVGGSNFYLESLMFCNPAIVEVSMSSSSSGSTSTFSQLKDMSAQDMHTHLRRIDPEAADYIHPHDSRRLYRALERIYRDKDPCSMSQKDKGCGTTNPHDVVTSAATFKCPLRFPNCVIVHVRVLDNNLHLERLSSRVDDMVRQGIVEETRTLYSYLHSPSTCWEEFLMSKKSHVEKAVMEYATLSSSCSTTTTESILGLISRGGISEAIGYKEFLPYIEAEVVNRAKTKQNTELKRSSSPDMGELLSNSIADVKQSTIRYAKRQATWIRNRLIPQCERRCVPIVRYCPHESGTVESLNKSQEFFTLGSVVSAVSDLVAANRENKIGTTTYKYNVNDIITSTASETEVQPGDEKSRLSLKRKLFYCHGCDNRSFQGKEQFDIHIASKKHKKRRASNIKKASRASDT